MLTLMRAMGAGLEELTALTPVVAKEEGGEGGPNKGPEHSNGDEHPEMDAGASRARATVISAQ